MVLRLGALLHDVGKPRAREAKADSPEEYSFYRHEYLGAEMAVTICQRLKLPGAERETVQRLVANHMFYYTPEWTDGTVRRFLRRVGVAELPALLALREADVAGRGFDEQPDKETRELRERVAEVVSADAALTVKDLAVGGREVMQALAIPPGPAVGRVLEALLERVLDDPGLNTAERLLALAREIGPGSGRLGGQSARGLAAQAVAGDEDIQRSDVPIERPVPLGRGHHPPDQVMSRGDARSRAQRSAQVQPSGRAQRLDGQHPADVVHHPAQLPGACTPMETWSSRPADEGIESTLAGWHRILFSLTSAAAVTWASMKPECSPLETARNGGSPDRDGIRALLDPPLGDGAQLGHGDGRDVQRQRHRLAVEVAARHDVGPVLSLDEHQRVVGGWRHLAFQHPPRRSAGRRARRRGPGACSGTSRRPAPCGSPVRLDDRRVGGRAASDAAAAATAPGCGRTAAMRGSNGRREPLMVSSDITPVMSATSTQPQRLGDRQGAGGGHQLGAVDQGQPLLGLQHDGGPGPTGPGPPPPAGSGPRARPRPRRSPPGPGGPAGPGRPKPRPSPARG